jgi:hypothetical protein
MGGFEKASMTVILLASLGLFGCGPARPSNVPLDATYIEGGEVGGWWQHCSFDSGNDVNRCQIYNAGGVVLSDEVFLPYDGGKALTSSLLKIDGDSYLAAGPNYVCLKDGRILIPKSHFQDYKSFIDSRIRHHTHQ